jgi:hypothetical protein
VLGERLRLRDAMLAGCCAYWALRFLGVRAVGEAIRLLGTVNSARMQLVRALRLLGVALTGSAGSARRRLRRLRLLAFYAT